VRPARTVSRSLADYESYLTDRDRSRIDEVGETIADERVVHVNSTGEGGGVAEMLGSLVPLLDDAGPDTDWFVLSAPDEFFDATKRLHNGLQGADEPFTDAMREAYREVTATNAAAPELSGADTVVLHDPQTLGLAPHLAERHPETRLVWRCHIDLTDATDEYVTFLRPSVEAVDRTVVSRRAYGTPLPGPLREIHPAIDPLSEKNCPVEALSDGATAAASLDGYPLDPGRPLIVQVSRFDPWKDPHGVVNAYRRVTETVPNAQLALVGGMPDDDPEGEAVYREVAAATEGDPDVRLLTDLPDASINALQRAADVVLQKSLREGFALTVSEALWKGTPVVGSDVGGIPLQIEDGETGYLVEPRDIAAAADRTVRLLTDDERRAHFGERGRETVRERFLVTRLLTDYLELLAELHRSDD
jgi:trehalose synthase